MRSSLWPRFLRSGDFSRSLRAPASYLSGDQKKRVRTRRQSSCSARVERYCARGSAVRLTLSPVGYHHRALCLFHHHHACRHHDLCFRLVSCRPDLCRFSHSDDHGLCPPDHCRGCGRDHHRPALDLGGPLVVSVICSVAHPVLDANRASVCRENDSTASRLRALDFMLCVCPTIISLLPIRSSLPQPHGNEASEGGVEAEEKNRSEKRAMKVAAGREGGGSSGASVCVRVESVLLRTML